jgi:hypothetical protein
VPVECSQNEFATIRSLNSSGTLILHRTFVLSPGSIARSASGGSSSETGGTACGRRSPGRARAAPGRFRARARSARRTSAGGAPQRSRVATRHSKLVRRSAPIRDTHEHEHHSHGDEHGHSHGLVHDSIKRSREGIRAVSLSLAVLGLTAIAQTVVFVASGSIALLADLIHNFGDALTAVPLGRFRSPLPASGATRRAGGCRRDLRKRLRGRSRKPASRLDGDIGAEQKEGHGDHLLGATLADRASARQPPQHNKPCRKLDQRIGTEPDKCDRTSEDTAAMATAASMPCQPSPIQARRLARRTSDAREPVALVDGATCRIGS